MKKITTNETTINNLNLRKFIIPLLLLSLVLIFLFTMSTASAAVRSPSPVSDTIYVNNATGNDSWDGQSATWVSGTKTGPKLSIKNATGTVTAGGIVHLADGTYTGANNRNIYIDRNMTIIGQSQSGTVINAQGADRMFIIPGGVSVTLQNMTLKNGKVSSSGGWVIIPGTGDDGGSIYNAGTLQINGCTFSGNSAGDGDYSTLAIGGIGGNGGAIYNSGILQISNSIFTNNRAGDGGGSGWFIGGIGGNGGAIYNAGTLYITNSIIYNNRAGYWGHGWVSDGLDGSAGAILNAGTLQIIGSIIRDNYAGSNHIGGIENKGNAEIHFNWITGNNFNLASTNSLVNATLNFWGTNSAPLGVGTNVNVNPWLVFSFTANPSIVSYLGTSQISANFLYDSNGVYHDPASGHIPDGIRIVYGLNWGTMDIIPDSSTTLNGKVKAIYHADWIEPIPQTATVYATLYETIGGVDISITISLPISILTSTDISENNHSSQNSVSKVNAASKTIPLQKTGLPLAGILLAILAVFSGLVMPKRK